MEGFYISIIFLGILIVLFSLIWTIWDKKKSSDYRKDLSEKREELIEIINDADQMINEMNKFSDYIVSKFSEKHDEVTSILNSVDERLLQLEVRAKVAVGQDFEFSSKVVKDEETKPRQINNMISENIQKNDKMHEVSTTENHKSNQKVIFLNNRYREVLKLADQGLSDTDIAKTLQMGKGEVRLVIDTCKKV